MLHIPHSSGPCSPALSLRNRSEAGEEEELLQEQEQEQERQLRGDQDKCRSSRCERSSSVKTEGEEEK
eukprot:759127-Hanusia_phi.AAC.1